MSSDRTLSEASRRRTFAIISHPDAGKTTLSEKLLLYAGAIAEAGAVKARQGRRQATSDWGSMERARGISISTSVLTFEHEGHVLNLLDTPGHRDFSEDTLRVLTGVDFAVMVLDAAAGVEEQTHQLFRVARERRVPLITFVNKYDRPGMEPLRMVDHIEEMLGIAPAPLTWPVGEPGFFEGVINRAEGTFHRFVKTPRGALPAAESVEFGGMDRGPAWVRAVEELELLDGVGARVDRETFLNGETTPVLFGSALSNFGVRLLLETIVGLAPAPSPRTAADGEARALDAPFSAQVFKVQANTDPRHRDRIAFMRICSGRFERGTRAINSRTGRPFAMSYAHEMFGRERQTADEAFPGDVIGVTGALELEIGDTLSADGDVAFPPVPTLAPERFAKVRNRDTARYKQFRRGIAQLDEEGVARTLRHPEQGEQDIVLAGVGPMQFEVAAHRLENEFGVGVRFEQLPWRIARRTDEEGERAVGAWTRGEVRHATDGTRLALFRDRFDLERFERAHPDVLLDPFVR